MKQFKLKVWMHSIDFKHSKEFIKCPALLSNALFKTKKAAVCDDFYLKCKPIRVEVTFKVMGKKK